MNFEKNYLALDQLISPLEVYPILPHAVEGCEDGHHRRQKNWWNENASFVRSCYYYLQTL